MAVNPIAARYAQALFESADAEGAIEPTLEQLTSIAELLQSSDDLRTLMLNPDVDPDQKVGILDRVLKGSWSALVRSFVDVVVSMGRADALPSIVEAYHALVDERQGRLRVTVRSARPLGEGTARRLQTILEQRQRKVIDLHAEVDPSLLGGLEVRLDHRVIDGTVRRQLDELRERLTTLRVH